MQDIVERYEEYSKYTRERNWKAICQMNGVSLISIGTRKELARLGEFLEEGEVVFALATGIMKQTGTSNWSDSGLNTWLVALTSERFLFMDCALMTRSVDTQSIRHDRVQAVSASQGWMFGKIQVDLGARVVIIDNCKKEMVSVVAELANKWLRTLETKKSTPPPLPPSGPAASPIDQLEKLANLHAMGALTAEEFAAAKAQLLGLN